MRSLLPALLVLAACSGGEDKKPSDKNPSGVPVFTFVEPNGIDDVADDSFIIAWTDEDPDDNATITLSYDDGGGPLVEIRSGIPEDDERDRYEWDTSALPDGVYTVHASISDPETTVDVTGADVTVAHQAGDAPTISIDAPGAGGATADASYTIEWTDEDPDSDAIIDLFWDTNAGGADGTPIVTGLSEDDETDAHTWDTSTLPAGTYWIYAVIDDGFTSVTDYANGALTIDHGVPTITVDEPDGVADDGRFGFTIAWTDHDSDDDATVDLYWDTDNIGFDGTAIITGLSEDDPLDMWFWNTAALPDGDYWIYAVIDDGTNSTSAYSAGPVVIDRTCVTIADGGSAIFDLDTVEVTFDLTLNGALVSAANTGDLDEGGLILVNPLTNDVVPLIGAWDDTNDVPMYPLTHPIAPAFYDVYYTIVDNGPNWPDNQFALIEEAVDLTAPTYYTVDIPVVDVTLDVTLGGAALDASNTSTGDRGSLLFRDPPTGDYLDPIKVWSDANASLVPLTLRLVPTVWDVFYRVDADGPNWPSNDFAKVADNLDLGFTQSATIDVPVVNITIDLTLDGAPVDATNTGGDDEGRLVLRSGIDTAVTYSAWDDINDVSNLPWSLQIVPGTYDVAYQVVNAGPNWPANGRHTLLPNRDLSVDGSLNLAIPVAQLTADLTLDGVVLDGTNTGPADHGRLLLRDSTGDTVGGPPAWDSVGAAVGYPAVINVIPGLYDVYYDGANGSTAWPGNTNAKLASLADLSLDTTASWDIPVSVVTVDATLDGSALSGTNTSDGDHGRLTLTRTGDSVPLGPLWDTTGQAPTVPRVVPVVRGTYDVSYGLVAGLLGGNWPFNSNVQIYGTVDLSADTSVSWDIPVHHSLIGMTLNGTGLSGSNTGDGDEGSLRFVDSSRSTVSMPGAWDDANDVLLTPYATRLVPGPYDVTYAVVNAGANWPNNLATPLPCMELQ